jgi:hypothetical protein
LAVEIGRRSERFFHAARRTAVAWPLGAHEDACDRNARQHVVQYRFMFLERNSEFSQATFQLTLATHGYEATREAAMQAFARSWHREPQGERVLAAGPFTHTSAPGIGPTGTRPISPGGEEGKRSLRESRGMRFLVRTLMR